LALLYCCRFGHTVSDALKSVGFTGKLQDFVEQQNDLAILHGYVSLQQSGACKEDDETTVSMADTESTADAEDGYLDSESDGGMPWKTVGDRLATSFYADDEDGVCTSHLKASLPPGMEAEILLSEQLYDLLQDRTLPLTELGLLYCCRFGMPVSDALKTVGFNARLEDFLQQLDRFSIRHGCVSRRQSQEEDDEMTGLIPDTADDDNCYLESGSNSAMPWKALGGRLAAAFDAGDDEDEVCTFNPNAWRSVGSRIAATFRDRDQDDSPDPAAWHDVGTRFAVAFKQHCEE